MRDLVMSFLVSAFVSLLALYLFLYHYVRVVDGVRVVKSLEEPLLRDAIKGGADVEEVARKKILIFKAFKLALDEQRGVVFVSQSVLKSPFKDVTDEVLERTRYWYAYLVSSGGYLPSEGGSKQGRKPEK